MTVRTATIQDLEKITQIYDAARTFMRENGNATQWAGGYPQKEIILEDINNKICHIVEQNSVPVGVFAFFIGDDETYKDIDGKWINNDTYGVIHRVASNGRATGVFDAVLGFCLEKTHNLRIDTHKDNTVMQHVVEKNGFKKCGTIITHDGTPRIAYQRI